MRSASDRRDDRGGYDRRDGDRYGDRDRGGYDRRDDRDRYAFPVLSVRN